MLALVFEELETKGSVVIHIVEWRIHFLVDQTLRIFCIDWIDCGDVFHAVLHRVKISEYEHNG